MKETLIVDLGKVDASYAATYDIASGSWLMKYDFVLVTEAVSRELRDHNSITALSKLERKVKMMDGLPVPDVD